MKIRTVHHLSATGGTLISHAIASLQHVFLLSELNPLTRPEVRFDPIDPLAQLGARYDLLTDYDYNAAFLERLRPVAEAVERRDGILVIRDHSHSDWLGGTCRGQSALLSALRPVYETASVVTLRHPIEAYSSMMLNGWDEEVGDFDTYCGRTLQFVDYFSDSTVFHYEDFVIGPGKILSAICEALELPFSTDWEQRFRQVTLTGDSGRGLDHPIQPLPVKPISERLLSEIRRSSNFLSLADRFGYVTDPDELIRKRQEEIRKAGVKVRAPEAAAHRLSDAELKLRNSLEAKDNEILELHESIQRKDERLSRAKRTIDLMRQSNSWRLTAPLRSLRSFFGSGG